MESEVEPKFNKPEETKKIEQTTKEKRKSLLTWIFTTVALCVAILLCSRFIVQPRYVIGDSMQNTFHNNDFVIIWKLNYQPQRGDVVITNDRNALQIDLIKRVIAVGGDHVIISNGAVTLNGKKLHEVYIKEQKWSGNNVDLVVPKGDVFLMGDNRNNSSDSRIIGPVPNSDISGKVSVRLFPFSQFRTF